MLKSESQANEELSERVQQLERDYYQCKKDKEALIKENKRLNEQKEALEFRNNEFTSQKEEHINLLKT